MKTYFLNGSWNVVCDVCGFRFKAVEIVRRWDGAMTCRSCYEPRHPQDFIRVRDERVSVPFTRPEADVFVPQTTGVSLIDNIILSETIRTQASFVRYIPPINLFLEPLVPLSHALGLQKLNEETLGGTAAIYMDPEERIVLSESISYSLTTIADINVLNGHKLNEVTLG